MIIININKGLKTQYIYIYIYCLKEKTFFFKSLKGMFFVNKIANFFKKIKKY